MSSTITANVVEGQIDTASGLLRWIEAEADKTRRAISVTPLLCALAYILGSIIKELDSQGIKNFDELHAGHASLQFREVHRAIHRMISRSRQAGLYSRIPSSRLFAKVEEQGKQLEKLSHELSLIDERWNLLASSAANEKIALARQSASEAIDQSIILFDTPDDPSTVPSEDAVRTQFHRAANLSANNS